MDGRSLEEPKYQAAASVYGILNVSCLQDKQGKQLKGSYSNSFFFFSNAIYRQVPWLNEEGIEGKTFIIQQTNGNALLVR